MRFACWITKATNTHSEYVICIALPRQQRLRERALTLRLRVRFVCVCVVVNVALGETVERFQKGKTFGGCVQRD